MVAYLGEVNEVRLVFDVLTTYGVSVVEIRSLPGAELLLRDGSSHLPLPRYLQRRHLGACVGLTEVGRDGVVLPHLPIQRRPEVRREERIGAALAEEDLA